MTKKIFVKSGRESMVGRSTEIAIKGKDEFSAMGSSGRKTHWGK